MGRPSTYSAEVGAEICTRLAAGETLRAICRPEHMPPGPTVRGWVIDNVDDFAERYTRARQVGYEDMADELTEIADDTSNDTLTDAQGADRPNTEWITRSRLKVDTRKWLLSKALPKIYGDRITQELTGPNGGPIKTEDAGAHAAILTRLTGIEKRLNDPTSTGAK